MSKQERLCQGGNKIGPLWSTPRLIVNVPHMRRTGMTLASILTATLLAVSVTGCGKDSGADEAASPDPASSPTASAPASPDSPLTRRIRSVNEGMRSTSFHGSGTTTALGGGEQEIWSDPEQGLHMRMTGKNASGAIYCKGGTTYMSAQMVAETVNQQGGVVVTVPDRLADVYVTTETGDGCDVFYRISDTATPANSEKPRKVSGKETTAVTVSDGAASDLYFIENGAPHLLRQESTRDGRTSTTTYDSFGEKVTVTAPADTMPMDEFREQVMGS